jgi:hypothetical protein
MSDTDTDTTSGLPPDREEDGAAWADYWVRQSRSRRVAAWFGFEPHDYQAVVLDDGAPELTWNAGRRSGKTVTAGAVPADWALTHGGEDALILAPYQETADEMFRETKEYLDSFGDAGSVGIDTANEKTYELANGARVMSRTLGTEGRQQRGKGPSCIVLDEAAVVDETTIRQVIRPMFATHDHYEFWLTSTPNGQQGYFYEKHVHDDSVASYHNTTADNPLVGEEWLADERASVDDLTWRQEYMGEFLELGNAYLSGSLVAPCMPGRNDDVADPPAIATDPEIPKWLGVDPARGGADRSVFTSVDALGRVFDLQAWDQQTVPEAVGQIKTLDREHGYEGILIDENAVGGGVVDFADEDLPNVEPVVFSSKSKQAMYTNLKKCLEDEDLLLPNEDRLFYELTGLQYNYTKSGILRVEHPPGGHDDYPDSLALAVHGREIGATGGGARIETRRGMSASTGTRRRTR